MQMKIYTEIQTNLTTWNTKDAGYVINGSAFSTSSSSWDYGNEVLGDLYTTSYSVSLVLSSILFIAILYIIYTKTPKNSESDRFLRWHSLFWTSVGVLMQFILLLLIIDIDSIRKWCNSPTGCSAVGEFKIIWLLYTLITAPFFCPVYLLLPYFLFKVLKRKEVHIVPFLKVEREKLQLLFPPIISSLVYFAFYFIHVKPKYITHLFNCVFSVTLLVSLSIFLYYLLPVMALLLVYPIKVASAYSFLTAALILYILIAFYGEYKRPILFSEKTNEKKSRLLYYNHFKNFIIIVFYLYLPLLNMMLILIIWTFFVSVYNIISDGYPQNSVLHAIVSFLPSLILSSFIWLFKYLKWLDKKEDATSNTDTPSQGSRQQEHSDDSTPDVDMQQELREREQLLQPQRQYGTTNELEHRV